MGEEAIISLTAAMSSLETIVCKLAEANADFMHALHGRPAIANEYLSRRLTDLHEKIDELKQKAAAIEERMDYFENGCTAMANRLRKLEVNVGRSNNATELNGERDPK